MMHPQQTILKAFFLFQKQRSAFALSALTLLSGALSACLEPADTGNPPAQIEPLGLLEGCNPLLSEIDCTLPYPSDFFRRPDPSVPNRYRVQLTGEGRIFTGQGYSGSVTDRDDYDGFSRTPTLTFLLNDTIDQTQPLSRLDGDYNSSILPTHKIIILNAETGEAVPHFVDFDARADDEKRVAVQLRVLRPLEENTRYIVGVHGLKNPAGDLILPTEGFRRLQQEKTGEDPAYEGMQNRYAADVFSPLETFGLVKEELQLAWDFTTGSDLHAMKDMLQMRDLVLADLELNAPEVEIIGFFDPPDDDVVFRRIYGTLTGPLVMEHERPGAEIARDTNGNVALNGRMTFPFTAVIPRSVAERFAPAAPAQFGHGFFGEQSEVERGRTTETFNATENIAFAINWLGMSTEDSGILVTHLGGEEVWRALTFSDRLVQAMANSFTLDEALKNHMAQLPEFTRPLEGEQVIENPANAGQTNAGLSYLATNRIHFMGISLGHILGGVLCALHPRIERCGLQVGGGGFSYMMSRSSPFFSFLYILDVSVPNRLDQQKVATTLQRGLDRVDPLLYAPYLAGKPLPKLRDDAMPTPEHQILLQTGLVDTSVPNFTSYLHARILGIPVLTPTVVEPWELPLQAEPGPRGMTIFDLGVVDVFSQESRPPDFKTATHNAIRNLPEAKEQLKVFFETGIVQHPCNGPCELPLP